MPSMLHLMRSYIFHRYTRDMYRGTLCVKNNFNRMTFLLFAVKWLMKYVTLNCIGHVKG